MSKAKNDDKILLTSLMIHAVLLLAVVYYFEPISKYLHQIVR